MADYEALPIEVIKDWRNCFNTGLLDRGNEILQREQLHDFSCDNTKATAEITTAAKSYSITIGKAPIKYEDDWDPRAFSCNCASKIHRSCTYHNKMISISVCAHEAAVLLYWERQHGPWHFTEPPEIRRARLEAERRAFEEKKRQEWISEERRRRAEQRQKEKKNLPAASFFTDGREDGTFFDVRAALSRRKTTLYAVNRAKILLESAKIDMTIFPLSFDKSGNQKLSAEAEITDDLETRETSVALISRELVEHRCNCRNWYYYGYDNGDVLCEHELALLSKMREYILREDPGDATDQAGNAFFQELDAGNIRDETNRNAEKTREFVLSPRIIMEDGAALLSFKAGLREGKMLMLKNYREFLDAAEEGKPFALSKAVTVDFSKVDFIEESVPWLRFLQRRVSETDVANERMERQNRNFYGYSRLSLTVRTRDELSGATLDRFYDLAEGSRVEFQDKYRQIDGTIQIGHIPVRVRLSSERAVNQKGAFLGISVTGQMPSVLRGSAGSYIFNERGMSRITREEEQALRPFQAASDAAGNIHFRVGKDHLAEFYYRVVPRLLESSFVDFDDHCAADIENLLPPEPSFTFHLDVQDGDALLCEALVAYGGNTPRSLGNGTRAGYRDTVQEERVLKAVSVYFPRLDTEKQIFWDVFSESALYRLVTEGLADLERYGAVTGSDAFRRNLARPMPAVRVGVSIDSGLLDISVLSKDLTPEELLDILNSYREKKRYYRLKSGEFINLEGDEQLSSLQAMLDGLNLSAEELLKRGAELPAYRALYLDKLLETHDALVSSRDRTYRALIKNFNTIRDADYEVPDAQAEILRPYQVYGYKWLRTLAAAGFGGILADEMGLGKTVQTISLLQALKEEGGALSGTEPGAGAKTPPALVVCPASLVFNWQEEFLRFAPGLNAVAVAGSAAVRKKLLDQPADVYITSYDLLRKDVTNYERMRFSAAILDEAQYIKNQKAAMTKAVKVLHAEHRFALTGTPIENRLAELWSIFDFLMPGFLYAYPDFSRHFETPIAKSRDPAATAKLRQMTGPFILRRLKGDVLKDLPAKIEEVRWSRFEDEQRKVYDGQVVRMKQLLVQSGAAGQDKVRIFAELLRIRQICCDPSLLFEDYSGGSAKREACLELIQNAIGGGHRMLLFSQFTSMLALLEEDLKQEGIGYYKITGSTPKEQRLRLVRDFNEGDTPVFLISLKAGGTGLNLTGADVVIHYDPWWNLAAQDQATDRAHRIGQTRQVTVYRMIVKDSIEEKILELQESKRDLAGAILNGESASLSSLSNEELLELLS